ncbi:MAG: 5-(carboxyamino)imidazole ribonucleotide synthase [Aeromonadaceae bacterium]
MKLLILGGGQLARMLALSAAPLGIVCRVVDSQPQGCAADVADFYCREWQQAGALEDLLAWADVVTYESESIPVGLLESIASRVPLYPPVMAQRLCGDRVLEKQTLTGLGIPVAPHCEVNSQVELEQAVAKLGLPAILKWRTQGYDGKGQWRLDAQSDLAAIWRAAESRPAILEAMVPFSHEVSLVAARNVKGEVVCYPLTENCHRQGILHSSFPRVDHPLQQQAEQYAHTLLSALEYVGVLAIEFFVHEGRLVANEVAPRVHNSGHWTLEGAQTSQFANHLRAVSGLPLGSTALLAPTAMLNLIGKLPDIRQLLTLQDAHLHLYGKEEKAGRKLGHLTLRSRTGEELSHQWQQLEQLLAEAG